MSSSFVQEAGPAGTPGYWHLWAKAANDGRWHALPCHLLDVAASAESLWRRLPARAVQVPVQAFGGSNIASRACAFLAAAHDLGKCNRYFQAKAPTQYSRLQRAGVDLPPPASLEPKPHGQATGAYLTPWLARTWQWSGFAATATALAAGGHHGVYFADAHATTLGVASEPWFSVGRQLLDDLAATLQIPPMSEPASLNALLGWLSGFISVADWLGSHEAMTLWQMGPQPLPAYYAAAQSRADRLLDGLGWLLPPQTAPLGLADVLPPGCAPKPLQQAASEVAADFSLAIVEAPTGEGKTEAAFILAEAARSQGAGVYFALPTMATANGLYQRVQAYLQKATGDDQLETRLLHSMAWLFRDSVGTAPNPGAEGRDQDTHAQDWFAGSKRGLLAPYGVGTIDQPLIAALRARHGFVRLFALAGKVVVIDEVHAYHVYMADLLDTLLGWLRALGTQVVLLSATLPSARRAELLRAWGFCGPACASEYPGISWIDSGGNARSLHFSAEARKPLHFQPISAKDGQGWAEGAARILGLVQTRGGQGALVLNTVRDAQQAFAWLEAQGLQGVHLELFHARFTAQDRSGIEQRVLARFGKEGPRQTPAILVATQVVEQSLDLDFDHMVSALAPVDLLIQRAGRLHRHRRSADGRCCLQGPDQRPVPVLHVITPASAGDAAPELDDPVYSPDILLRTLAWLRASPALTQPTEVSAAVEAVYGSADRAAIMAGWERRLSELEQQAEVQRQAHERQAQRATIATVDDEDRLIVESFLDLDENDDRQGSQLAARTRLEDRPSITVVLLRQCGSRLETLHGGDADRARDAVMASLSISPPIGLWRELLEIEPLAAWARRGSLSHSRPLRLVDGAVCIGAYEVCYSSQQGLMWRRTNGDV